MNKELTEEKSIPIFWENYDVYDDDLCFYDGFFYENFGIFKENERFINVTLNINTHTLKSFDLEGNDLKTQKIKIIPVE